MQGDRLSYDIDTILKNVNNNITEELLRDIYTGSSTSLYKSKEADIMIGTKEDDILTVNKKSKILLNGGLIALNNKNFITLNTYHDNNIKNRKVA